MNLKLTLEDFKEVAEKLNIKVAVSATEILLDFQLDN